MSLPLTQIPVPVATDAVSHTQGPWRRGNVADVIIADVPAPKQEQEITAYYGGFVICESVSEENIPLITAAPDMLREIEKEIAWLEHIKPQISSIESVLVGFNQAIKYLKAVASKAKGES